jgi:hypothetical protein
VSTCLLCPSPAVADGLCVEDGARLWAALSWQRTPEATMAAVRMMPDSMLEGARGAALHDVPTPAAARTFLDKYEAAKAARAAAPLCSRGCKSHDGEEER